MGHSVLGLKNIVVSGNMDKKNRVGRSVLFTMVLISRAFNR